MTSPHRTQHPDMERPLGFWRGIYNAVKIEVVTIAAFVGIAVLAHALMGCSPANKEWVQEHACEKWRAQGFECVDYAGYEWGFTVSPTRGGANVWHRLRKIPDNGITYQGYVQRWGDEIHVYGPSAVDAIQP